MAVFLKSYVGSIEVSLRAVKTVGVQPGGSVFLLQGQAYLLYHGAVHLGRECPESLLHVLQVSVYVKVVGVHCSNHGNVRMKLQETMR